MPPSSACPDLSTWLAAGRIACSADGGCVSSVWSRVHNRNHQWSRILISRFSSLQKEDGHTPRLLSSHRATAVQGRDLKARATFGLLCRTYSCAASCYLLPFLCSLSLWTFSLGIGIWHFIHEKKTVFIFSSRAAFAALRSVTVVDLPVGRSDGPHVPLTQFSVCTSKYAVWASSGDGTKGLHTLARTHQQGYELALAS